MKKLFLLSALILFSALSANAVNWQPLEVATPNIDVYVDRDTIKAINSYEYYYAIRYQVYGQPEKIAYIKANSKTNLVGIIESGDFELENYRPNAVFATPHAFMKPLKEDSFLYYANDTVAQIALNTVLAESEYKSLSYNRYGTNIPVSYRVSRNAKDYMTPADLENYLSKASALIKENWNPPASAYGTRTTIKATIGNDGSLQGFKIIDSSNNDTNDRSVISALEKTVIFPRYTVEDSDVDALDFQFIFVKDLVKKSVVY